jgi:ABC-type transport system involved in multi-copper enzyme maturation permease subunit
MELKRSFRSSSFAVALIVGLAILGQGLYSYGRGFPVSAEAIARGVDPFIYNMFDAVISARLGLMSVLAPLLAALPSAASLALDRSTGYIRSILLRSKRHRYIASKFIANALAGGLAIVLPHLVIYTLAAIVFPKGLMDYATFHQQRIIVTGPLAEIYRTDPSIYIWFLIVISFLFGVVYASIGMFVSVFTDNSYVVLASPFVFYLIASFLIASLGGLEGWLPTATFTPQQVTTTTWTSIFGEFAILFFICTLGMIIYIHRGLRNS